jgi:hypothetical protein
VELLLEWYIGPSHKGGNMATKTGIDLTTPLPAISVRQPYAELIALGFKDMEFRSWNTK